jgi:hypothetical protein
VGWDGGWKRYNSHHGLFSSSKTTQTRQSNKTRRDRGDNAWKKRDKGRQGLIKWPMAASPARPTGAAAQWSTPGPGLAKGPGFGRDWLLLAPILATGGVGSHPRMGSWTHRGRRGSTRPNLFPSPRLQPPPDCSKAQSWFHAASMLAQPWSTSQNGPTRHLGFQLTRNAPYRTVAVKAT